MTTWLIGLDDTDYADSIGTGALARELQIQLVQRLKVKALGATRHQLLVHPDIPYTSHNSAACIRVRFDGPREALAKPCAEFLRFLFHEGADPGLCLLEEKPHSDAFMAFGRRAQVEVLKKTEALELAVREGIHAEELGGTGGGVIGALAACALRLSQDDGRFLSLPGIRDIDGTVTVGELLATGAIHEVVDETGAVLAPGFPLETRGWIRPDLVKGRAVLKVERRGDHGFVRRKQDADK